MKRYFTFILFYILSTNLIYGVNLGRIKSHEVSYYVQDMVSGKILLQHNIDKAMTPASIMKLVTAFAAFKALGINYQWITNWTTDGSIKDNTLFGNLYWKGSGDPVMDQQDLINMQIQLMQQQIFNIGGNLVLDKSLQAEKNTAAGFDDDKNEVFTTPPDPHNLAYKVIWIYPFQNEQGKMILGLEPMLSQSIYSSNIKTADKIKTCSRLDNYITANWNGSILKIDGKIPPSCIGEKMFLNIFSINDYIKHSFIGNWTMLGNEGPNNVIIGTEPRGSKILATHTSPELYLIIKDMNKFSNNLIARSLFLEIGKFSKQSSAKTIKHILNKAKINTQNFSIENGSGLSRTAKVTSQMMGQILYESYYSKFRHELINSLPEAGIDGTLKSRFKDISNLFLKTGSLKNVRSLAGYKLPTSKNENPLAIVVIVNSPHAEKYLTDLDNLVRSLLNDLK